jgi:hypothetical protein
VDIHVGEGFNNELSSWATRWRRVACLVAPALGKEHWCADSTEAIADAPCSQLSLP